MLSGDTDVDMYSTVVVCVSTLALGGLCPCIVTPCMIRSQYTRALPIMCRGLSASPDLPQLIATFEFNRCLPQ